MFISKKKYQNLVTRIKTLESMVGDLDGMVADRHGRIFDNWTWSRETLYEMMLDFFKHNAEVILVHRDKEKIIGELKGIAVDNIFKEDK